MHLVGFIIRIFHDARLPERQKNPEYVSRKLIFWQNPELRGTKLLNIDEV